MIKTAFRDIFIGYTIFVFILTLIVNSMGITTYHVTSFNTDYNNFILVLQKGISIYLYGINQKATNSGNLFLGIITNPLTDIYNVFVGIGFVIYSPISLIFSFILSIGEYIYLPFSILPPVISGILITPIVMVLIISFILSFEVVGSKLGGN